LAKDDEIYLGEIYLDKISLYTNLAIFVTSCNVLSKNGISIISCKATLSKTAPKLNSRKQISALAF